MGKEDATNGIHFTQGHLLLHTYIQARQSCNVQAKSITTDYKQGSCTVTYTDLLTGHGATAVIQKQQEDPLIGKGVGWTTWVFMTRDLEDRTGPARP